MRHLRTLKPTLFVALALTAFTCEGLTPLKHVESFEVVFKHGESTLAPSEIKKFSAAFEELKGHGWCVQVAVAYGNTAHDEAATDSQRQALASSRAAYLKKVLTFFEPKDDRTYSESKLAMPSEAVTAGLTTVKIVGYLC